MGSKQIAGVQVPALPIVGLTTFNSASSFIIEPTYYCDWAVIGVSEVMCVATLNMT